MKKIELTYPDHLANEAIKTGDVFHGIYEVTSAPRMTENGAEWRIRHRRWDVDLKMTRPDPRELLAMGQPEQQCFVSTYQRRLIPMQRYPRIEAFYDVRHIGGSAALFSEWTENGTLADCMANGSLYRGEREAVAERLRRIAGQIARGLQFLEDEGCCHGFVRPENIVITDRFNAKISVANKHILCGRQPDSDKLCWAMTVIEMYLGHAVDRDPENILDRFFAYRKQTRAEMPESLERPVFAALCRKLPTWQHVFLHLREPLTREAPLYASAYREGNNAALRLLDCGKTEAAREQLRDLSGGVSDESELACYNLVLLSELSDAAAREEGDRLYRDVRGGAYRVLLAAQRNDREELHRLLVQYGDHLPAAVARYLPAVRAVLTPGQAGAGSRFRAPFLLWRNESGEEDAI